MWMEKQKAEELKHPKSISQLGYKCVMCFIIGVAVLQSFQLYKRALEFPAVTGRVCSVTASTTHKQRGNKIDQGSPRHLHPPRLSKQVNKYIEQLSNAISPEIILEKVVLFLTSPWLQRIII